ncbi:MAG: YbaB/EbfC family nucleoid-associated protein [Planctomycetota bacterium]|nr:YbaB/EbfC family nucleoid-associated protein [Planctomycetota bacterium]
MSGTFGEMGNLLKQAQQMQRELDRVREELARTRVEGSAGGGVVRVEATADGMIQKVHVRPDLVSSGDVSMIEETVLAAVRDALVNATKMREEKMKKVTGGLNLPGLF